MIIAIDFDGTIVENKYPQIGREIPFATETIKALEKKGHRIILWTMRYGELLDEAVAFCESRGVSFYAVNKSFPEEEFDEKLSRKVNADLFIDDRNYGGLPSWGEIYQKLCPGNDKNMIYKKPKGLISKLIGK